MGVRDHLSSKCEILDL